MCSLLALSGLFLLFKLWSYNLHKFRELFRGRLDFEILDDGTKENFFSKPETLNSYGIIITLAISLSIWPTYIGNDSSVWDTLFIGSLAVSGWFFLPLLFWLAAFVWKHVLLKNMEPKIARQENGRYYAKSSWFYRELYVMYLMA